MKKKFNNRLRGFASELRNNLTNEERRLWFCFLRAYPAHKRKKKVIGNYIADFYCAEANLVIELDGSQHYEDRGAEYDAARTEYFKAYGIDVIRISNAEVRQNFSGVCEHIDRTISRRLGINNYPDDLEDD